LTAKEPCPKCQDTNWVLKDSNGSTVAVRCSCYNDQKNQILINQSGIPKRYANCSFDNFESEHDKSLLHALKIAKKLVQNYPAQEIGLLFQGPCGVGKTHLAAAIINELISKKKVACYFCDFRELIRNIQSSYSPESNLNESDLLYPIFKREVLVLDELGAKRTTAWVEETIFYIINYRYNNKKLTIFTSNYIDNEEEEEDLRDRHFKNKDDSLIDRIGYRLRSRIYEMCKIVNMNGKDYRKEVKQGGYRF
jgi:DNA replication protein DnaC